MVSRWVSIGMAGVLVLAGLATATTWTVGPGGGYDYSVIQDAIDASSDGDTVIVSEGTYLECIDFSGKAITVQSTDPENSDVMAATIIDANSVGRTVTFANGEDPNSLLTGFTITGGQVTGTNNSTGSGGGIYCYYASPTINNCIIQGNYARLSGGGIYCYYSDAVISDCTVQNNTVYSSDGAGIYWCRYSDAELTMDNCTIQNNSYLTSGGSGMYYYQSKSGCRNFSVTNCRFLNNAGIGTLGGGLTITSSQKVSNCIFEGNTGTQGGGLLAWYTPEISNCTFIQNNTSSSGGTAVSIYGSFSYSSVISNCVLANNAAASSNSSCADGGALMIARGLISVENCTIVDNDYCNFTGGIMVYDASTPEIKNCILWNNTVNGVDDPNSEIYLYSTTADVSYCDVQGGWSGTGNIDEDPNFVDDEYHLSFDSPCINAGDPNGDYTDQVDMDDQDRVSGGVVDIGADEYSDYRYYKFDETSGTIAYDSSFVDVYDATLVNGPVWESNDGVFDGSLSFDGVDDYVIVNDPNFYGIGGTSARTVSVWFKTTSTSVRRMTIVQWGTTETGKLWMLSLDGNFHARVDVVGGGVCNSSKLLNDGLWHNVVVVQDEGDPNAMAIQLYVDGELDAVPQDNTCTSCIDTDASDIPLHIGGWYNTGSNSVVACFAGKIDDVRIYPTAWDADDVEEYYLSAPFVRLQNDAVIYYNCDEGSGSTLTDISGDTEEDATLVGPAWSTAGVHSNALSFDGTNDYGYVSGYYGVGGTSARSTSLWVKANYSSSPQTLVQWGAAASGQLWLERILTDGTVQVAVFGGVHSSGSVRDGTWHHIVAVLDEGETDPANIRLYIDGELDVVAYDSTAVMNTSQTVQVHLGAWYNTGSNTRVSFLNGSMDDIRIYDQVLSEDDIQVLYTEW